MHRYVDDVLSLNNFKFCDFVDRTYIELEKKDTTDAAMSVSFLNLHRSRISDQLRYIYTPYMQMLLECCHL
jgi:hypothetical protein